MSQNSTLDSRLKQIRKELSLIDKDLKTLSSTAAGTGKAAPKPRLKSRELREKVESTRAQDSPGRGPEQPRGEKRPVLQRDEKRALDDPPEPVKGKNERFLEYLSSSFNSGLPLRHERRVQRNKAVVMLVIVLFILFLVLYRMAAM